MKIPKSYNTLESFSSPDIRIFHASNKYAQILVKDDGERFIVKAVFSDLIKNDISAVHIHSNVNGSPGPILVWLLTSQKWQNGVLQQTPAKNAPCCSNATCSLIAPSNTLDVSSVQSNKIYTINITKKYCGFDCPGITIQSPFAFLVIHGVNFQTVMNGCLSSGQPVLDVLEATPLIKGNHT